MRNKFLIQTRLLKACQLRILTPPQLEILLMNLTKNITFAAGLAVLGAGAYIGSVATPAGNVYAADKVSTIKLDNEKAKLGYTFGAQIAGDMKNQNLGEDIELEAMFAAFKDIFAGHESRLTIEEMQASQTAYQQKQQAKYEAKITENKAKGDAYLAKNAKVKGVKTTESGLQYEILTEGKGKQATATDSIKVHYTGTLIDGTKFDSSYDRGAPATFGVAGVIPGFGEGLQLMKEGGKYRFTIPSNLAYGEQGPPSIGPNQALIFEVQLIEVVSQSSNKKAAE